MVSRDEEGEVVAWVGWLTSQDLELVGTQLHESAEHVGDEFLKLITLDISNGNTDTVDTALDQAHLFVRFTDGDWLHDEGWVVLKLYLWVDLLLNNLRWEVSQVEDGVQVITDVN